MTELTHLNNDLGSPGDDSQTQIISESNIMHICWLKEYNINTIQNITDMEASSRFDKQSVSSFQLSLVLHISKHCSITIRIIIYYLRDKANDIVIQIFCNYSLLKKKLITFLQLITPVKNSKEYA